MTTIVELEIASIAAGGDGVARRDGLVVFVPRTAPGDRVRASVSPGRRFARGRLDAVVVASPARVEPRCAHYTDDGCGGCQLQHLDANAQADARRGIVRDTMRRIGRRDIDLPTFHQAPSPWRYRQRLTLALRKDRDGSWFGGLHAWHDSVGVFHLVDCLITDECVLSLWREVMAASALLPEATALRGTVRAMGDRGAFMLEGGRAWPDVAAFMARLPSFDGVWWTVEGGRRRRMDPPPGDADGAAPRGTDGRVPAASFSQVNPAVAAALFALVEAIVTAAKPAHVIDAYAGVGDLAAALHAHGIRVSAVEADDDAATFAALRLMRPSRAIAAKVEDVIDGLLPADVVVVNPPRSGLDERVAQVLDAATGVHTVVYVSCDPATLARDIARMPTWTIASVDAFDMFPQTAHVETVVVLRREGTR